LLIENTHISRIKEKPIVLQWMNPKSLSDLSDTTDALENKMSDNISNNASKTMSDKSDVSDTPTENYKTTDEKDDGNVIEEKKELETDVDKTSSIVNDSNTSSEIPDTVTTVTNQDTQSSSVVEQVAESESPRIGKKGSEYYCKEHPEIRNMHLEEIKKSFTLCKRALTREP
jgi:hypothetical protein